MTCLLTVRSKQGPPEVMAEQMSLPPERTSVQFEVCFTLGPQAKSGLSQGPHSMAPMRGSFLSVRNVISSGCCSNESSKDLFVSLWHKGMLLPWGKIIFRYGPFLYELGLLFFSPSRINWLKWNLGHGLTLERCSPFLNVYGQFKFPSTGAIFPCFSCQASMWHSFPGVIQSF